MNVAVRAHKTGTWSFDHADPRWVRLHAIIAAKSYMTGDFVLSSGRRSDYLFQLRQTTMLGEAQPLIAGLVLDFMKANALRCIGGMVQGAVPIVVATTYAGELSGHKVDGFFVRKKAKEHGAREQIDGICENGSDVLVVDDVTTSGGSIMEAVNLIRSERHCTVRLALSIVDREEGADEALAREGIKLVPLFRRSDFKI